MHTPEDSSLGREVRYPARYDPSLLFPIPRATARAELGLRGGLLPFEGLDRWQAYELGWLDTRGKPCVATATLSVPCDSPQLVESKSLKLYLNSLNGERFAHAQAVRERLGADLSQCADATVQVDLGLPPPSDDHGWQCIDGIEVDIDTHGPPDAGLLRADAGHLASQRLLTHLLKSNCPVTGQPDWASLRIQCEGPLLDPAALLRYAASYRDHAGFHEHCVERIFTDLMARCSPRSLCVEARYTRRGGLDINPWRATPGHAPPAAGRDSRQ